jgi:hypothetical protein
MRQEKNYIPIISREIEILRADPTMTEAKLRNLDIWIAPHHTNPIPVTDNITELRVEVYVIRRVTRTLQTIKLHNKS